MIGGAGDYEAYGYRRTWKALTGETAPRCRVQRLMRAHGIQGAKRHRKLVAHHDP